MKTYAYGVDIGGTTVKIGLFKTDGELLEKWEIPTRTEEDGRFILPDIAEAVKAKTEERKISPEDVEGIGVGVPGPVDDSGTVLKCVNLGWGIFNVKDSLALLTGWRVAAGNDANVAAMGELWQGGGKGAANMVMVTLGTGVGGGVIVDGKVISGSHGAAGEIGHLTVSREETEICGCGKKGCLEQYASANGVARLAKRYLSGNDQETVLRRETAVGARAVFDAAKAGDAAALAIVEQFGEVLGRALASVACVTDPEVFVIGGGVSKAGEIVTDVIRKYYTLYAFHASANTEFRIAELGNDAGIYGGVSMLLS
ncbi:MAG: ROK family glucokinase [Lachnospiraceae bacterium]|nr:ROK family glucokinase [Lachnospiraceae bacterium]